MTFFGLRFGNDLAMKTLEADILSRRKELDKKKREFDVIHIFYGKDFSSVFCVRMHSGNFGKKRQNSSVRKRF